MFTNKKDSPRRLHASRFHSQTRRRGFLSLLAGSCLLMGSAMVMADIGEQQWQKVLNVDDGSWDLTAFEGAEFRSDGSVLVSGSGDGGFAVRYDPQSGDLLDTPPEWIDFDTVSPNSNFNYFYDQVTDSNGDIFFAGRHDVFDPGTWKYNSAAELQTGWPKVSTGVGDGLYYGVALDSLGFVYSVGYDDAGWLISKNATSDGAVPTGFPITYNPGFGGKASHVAVDSENNFIVSGWVGVTGGSYDWHVRKYASNGTLIWESSYDLKGNVEAAIDVAVDSEDNIIFIGYRNDGSDETAGIARDWYMVKYAKAGDGVGNGTVLWEQSWNSGKASVSYVARTLLIDANDNFYVGGEQPDSSNTVSRALVQYRDGQTGALIRFQDIGHPVTARGAAGTAGNEQDYIKGLALNDDQLVVVGYVWEGYMLTGRTAWASMFKLLPDVGDEDWSSTYYSDVSTYNAMFYDVGFLSDGTVLANGEKHGSPLNLGAAIRYDADTGAEIDSPPEWIETPRSFRGQASDANGNLYFAGMEGTTMTAWKYSSNGVPIWSASGISSALNSYKIAVDSSGNSYTTGLMLNAVTASSRYDGALNKFDSSGNPAGAPFPILFDYGENDNGFYGIVVDSEDNIIVADSITYEKVLPAQTYREGVLRKYDSNGTLLWGIQHVLGGKGNYRGVAVDDEDNIIVSGYTNNGTDNEDGADYDWVITKFAKDDGAIIWEQTWDDGTRRNGYGFDVVVDDQNNIYMTGTQENNDGMTRTHVQYRDGQTGALLKTQNLNHVLTHYENADTEMMQQTRIALQDGKLAVSGWILDSSPSDYQRAGFVIALDRTFVVTPSAGANGSIVPATNVEGVAYQGTVVITATAESNYHVASISGCGINYTNTSNLVKSYSETTSAVTADCTVMASFAIDVFFDVKPSATGNGTIVPSTTQSVGFNETFSFALNPDDHFHVAGVGGTCPGDTLIDNPDGTSTFTTGAITENCTVEVAYAIDTYEVTPSTDGNGTTNPASVSDVGYNTSIEFTLYPNAAYHPDTVSGTCPAGSLVDNQDNTWTYTTGLIVNNCDVYFSFDNTFDVTPSQTGSGSVSPDTVQSVVSDNSIEFVLTPDDHFHVASVGGTCPDDTLISNPDGTSTFTTGGITADCTVIANFVIDTFEVTPSTDGNGTTNPASVTNADYNTSVEITLYPNATYHPDTVSGTCPAGSLVDNQDDTWTYTTGLIVASCNVYFSFDNTFDVTPISEGLGTIDPSAVVESVVFGNTVDFTLTPTTDKAPEPVTGTCPAGGLVDNMDGSWTYTTGAIVEDCTVIATFEDDTTFFVIPIEDDKAVIFGL